MDRSEQTSIRKKTRFHHILISCFLLPFIVFLLFTGCASTPRHPVKAYDAGKWDSAIDDARQWLEVHPQDTTVIIILGQSAFLMGDTTTGLDALQPLAFSIDDKKLNSSILDAAIAEGKLDLARELISRHIAHSVDDEKLDKKFAIVERRIHDSEIAAVKGDSAMLIQDWTSAARAFRSAISDYSGNEEYRVKLHLARAEMSIQNGDEDGFNIALKHVEKAIKLQPENALAWWIKGDVYLKIGDNEEARKSFLESLNLGIKSPYYQRAIAVVESAE